MPVDHHHEASRPAVPLSVIIPVGRRETCWRRLLDQIETWDISPEVIVVFADGDDANIQRFFAAPRRRRIVVPVGRALQLNAGARAASSSTLWFLHADSQVDATAANAMNNASQRQPDAIHFLKLAFADDGPRGMRLTAWGTRIRSRFLRLPFGDQGLCLPRRLFFQLGEYDTSARYGEDHLLVWRAHQHGVPVKQVAATIVTSARKYAERGWLRTTRQHFLGTWKQAFSEWIKARRDRRIESAGDSVAVAVFVKTPGHSPVKTRLAAEIGAAEAERCYRLSVMAIEAAVRAAGEASSIPIVPYWAVAEPEGLSDPLWQNFDRIAQPTGGLGERLAGVYEQLISRHRGVIFLGADSPQLTPSLLTSAVQRLDQGTPFVIGPADDGGFYLFGGTIPLPTHVWTSVVYSCDETCRQLCQQLEERGEMVRLQPLRDVDRLADLRAVLEEMSGSEEWLSEQHAWRDAFWGLL